MVRICKIIAWCFVSLIASYFIAAQFFKGVWHQSNSIYSVAVSYGLPYPCRAHQEVSLCFTDLGVTSDIFGLQVEADFQRVAIPVTSLVGSRRSVFADRQLKFHAKSGDLLIGASITFESGDESAGQGGIRFETTPESTTDIKFERSAKVSVSRTRSAQTDVKSVSISSLNASLKRIDQVCEKSGSEISLETTAMFSVLFDDRLGSDVPTDLSLSLYLPILLQGCRSVTDALVSPFLSNPLDSVLAAFGGSTAILKSGDRDSGDWAEFTSKLHTDSRNGNIESEFYMRISESEIRGDPQHNIVGHVRFQDFTLKDLARQLYILGLRDRNFYLQAPDNVIFFQLLRQFDGLVTIKNCFFRLGSYESNICD